MFRSPYFDVLNKYLPRERARVLSNVHDEIVYEAEVPMTDFIYALDGAGVMHVWVPGDTGEKRAKGFSLCTLQREDVCQFLVEAQPTCIACIARQQESAEELGALDDLEPALAASLKSVVGTPVSKGSLKETAAGVLSTMVQQGFVSKQTTREIFLGTAIHLGIERQLKKEPA